MKIARQFFSTFACSKDDLVDGGGGGLCERFMCVCVACDCVHKHISRFYSTQQWTSDDDVKKIGRQGHC